jgi:hypothetical protein
MELEYLWGGFPPVAGYGAPQPVGSQDNVAPVPTNQHQFLEWLKQSAERDPVLREVAEYVNEKLVRKDRYWGHGITFRPKQSDSRAQGYELFVDGGPSRAIPGTLSRDLIGGCPVK